MPTTYDPGLIGEVDHAAQMRTALDADRPPAFLARVPAAVLFSRRFSDLERYLADRSLPRPTLWDLAVERRARRPYSSDRRAA